MRKWGGEKTMGLITSDMSELFKMLDKNNLYFIRLTELCISMFKWKNLPDSIDERYLEMALLTGSCLFFHDEVLGHLALRGGYGGSLTVYNIPTQRYVTAANGYHAERTDKDSVIIWNNYTHTSPLPIIDDYAKLLMQISLAIQVNANAQKTPILIQCNERQKLTLMNIYKKYEGGAPVIFAKKATDELEPFTVINTGAPYVADKLQELKRELWNEALQYLGLLSVSTIERERQNRLESVQNTSAAMTARYTKLLARRQACKQINRMFGLDIVCDYNHEIDFLVSAAAHNISGEQTAAMLEPGQDEVALENIVDQSKYDLDGDNK